MIWMLKKSFLVGDSENVNSRLAFKILYTHISSDKLFKASK